MTSPATRARSAAKCARCGHPRAKHTTNPADGCTVKVGRPFPGKEGRGRSYPIDCPCRYFVERTG